MIYHSPMHEAYVKRMGKDGGKMGSSFSFFENFLYTVFDVLCPVPGTVCTVRMM